MRKSKKSKVPTIVVGTEGVEGHEEAPVAEPSVRDSQTLEGFHNRTAVSGVAKSHVRDHYSVHQKVLMRIPLLVETPNTHQEEGYTPVFGEFFNFGLRLAASPFVDSLLSSIGCAAGQLGPFTCTTFTAFQATEAAYTMALQWAESARVAEAFEREKSSLGEKMRRMREERNSALAEKDKLTQKYDSPSLSRRVEVQPYCHRTKAHLGVRGRQSRLS
ncbi:hypothetical protein LIER_06610 [Lithospermum erythrorhizon]|uniref:Uncharacterized protein n=1 Tax=Lithospermum erythrorhizon TaxID=34254 RepID=A0AAV3P663_LITER